MTIQERLFALQDPKFRDFQAKLCPTVDTDAIIGVKTPALKAMARELSKTGEGSAFLRDLPHRYFEENQLHAFLISQMKEYDAVIDALDRFLPFVDNWATCDQLRPKVFSRHRDRLTDDIERWLRSDHTYTIRFGIGMLMVHFLDADFKETYLTRVSRVRSSEYYVNMMIAWYFATALAKQYDGALPYLTECCLAPWVHNKTIQKARESYRITPEQKVFLNSLKLPSRTVE